MHRTRLLRLIAVLVVIASATVPAVLYAGWLPSIQEGKPGRGDDLARIQQWRAFLDRADRAFTAARMSTTAVKAKTTEADERIAELQDDPGNKKVGRSDITGDVAFLERAQRAFTAAKMSTTDVNRWLEEAKEATGEITPSTARSTGCSRPSD